LSGQGNIYLPIFKTMKRISNRRYPEIICENPACKIEFEPHDRRQKYCEPQCRTNANNDKRYLANKTRFRDENQARRNNKILEAIWSRLEDQKQKLVSRVILEWNRFEFDSQSSIKKNTKSGKSILWFYDYGLELVDPAKNVFEIHKNL
jgi:hypothetical protein